MREKLATEQTSHPKQPGVSHISLQHWKLPKQWGIEGTMSWRKAKRTVVCWHSAPLFFSKLLAVFKNQLTENKHCSKRREKLSRNLSRLVKQRAIFVVQDPSTRETSLAFGGRRATSSRVGSGGDKFPWSPAANAFT